MSELKNEISENKDGYWFFKGKFTELVKAIKEQDSVAITNLVEEHDKIKKAEDEAYEKWLNTYCR